MFTQHQAWLLIDAVRPPHDHLNWTSTAHWNPFAAGQTTAPIWLDTRQVRARQNDLPSATWFRLCEAKQRTLPRAQSIPGLTASHNHLEHDIKPTRTSFHLYSPPSSELSQSFYSYPNHQSKTGMVLKNTTCLIIKETNISWWSFRFQHCVEVCSNVSEGCKNTDLVHCAEKQKPLKLIYCYLFNILLASRIFLSCLPSTPHL